MHRQESTHSVPNTLKVEGGLGKLINKLWALGVIIGWKDNILTVIVDECDHKAARNIVKCSEGGTADE